MARHERIGNTAMVAFPREEMARAFRDRESFLAKKVVYRGGHAGDRPPLSEISLLGREIDEFECKVPWRRQIEKATARCSDISPGDELFRKMVLRVSVVALSYAHAVAAVDASRLPVG